jgi:hypothetical protein
MTPIEKQSKCENIAFLPVDISIWINFYTLAGREKDTLNLGHL